MSCECGSGSEYSDCCGALHAGKAAPTAEALMRSRYSAFARGLWPYLAQTQAQPFGPAPEPLTWVGLTIHEAKEDEVEFTARHLEGDREISLRERSKFEQRDGRWIYVTGNPQVTSRKLGRNDPCPCGSGKKLKACHG